MKNRRRIIATVVLLLLAAGAMWLARPWQAAGPDQFEPSVEESGPEPGVIYAEGRVVPLRQADLAFESNGRLQDALVEEGDEVEAGAPLIRLEATDAEIAVSQAQAALAQAEANLAAAEARLMSAEEGRQTAQLAIQAAEAELAAVQAGPREQEIESAKGAVAEANAGVAQAAGERDMTLERNQAEIAAAEARLEAAEANLFAVRIANQPIVQDEEKPDEEREQAQWRLNAAEAEVAAAQAELKRAQAGATEAEAEAAVNAVGYAAAQKDAAQAQLALVEAGARQEEIAIATEKVRQAQSAAEQAEARVSLAETAVRQAEADVEIARAQLSAAETALEKLTLRAPFAGTVADVHLKAGQGATAGMPAVTLADFSEWQVETTDLTELDVAQIGEGQPVQVTVDAFPGETIPGEIVEIAAAPQGAGVPSEAMGAPSPATGEDVTYEVTVTLDDVQELTLRWGMTAFVVVGAEASEWWNPPPSGDSINVEGEAVPARFRDLSFQTGGTVVEILVKEGQEVESGDALIQLEARQQEIALAQAQGRVLAAQAALETAENQRAVAQAEVEIAQREADVAAAQLALVKAGARPEEVKAAEARLAAARSGVAQAAAARDAQLENVGTEEQIESARAELGSAQADLKALQDRYDTIIDTCYDTPEGEVCPLYGPVEETTRAQLAAAEARAKAAQAALDRLLAGATEAQQRAANAAVTAAAARRDQAQAQLALVQAGATPEQIRQAEVALEMAQAQVAVAEAALEEAEAAVAQAEAGLAAAEAGVEAAQEAMERTTLRASLTGRVARLAVDPGEVVPAGSTVVTVAEGGEWRVETRDLTELDVARIEEGDAVSVSFEALPQTKVEGTVMQIALTPGMDRGDVVYEATIALHDTEQLALRWGMTAQVALQP